MSDRDSPPEVVALRRRLEAQQREFTVLERAFTLVTTENQALQQLLRAAVNTENLDALFDHTVDLMMDLLRAEAGSLFLIDREAGEVFFKVAKGPVGDKIKGFRVKLSEGIVGWVATENEPVAISDVHRDARFKREISDAVGYEVRSILAVPFRLRGQVHGVFEILNKEGGSVFLPDDRDMILTLANTLGLLLQLAGHERVE
ncbi:MAG: GAF domain-containing protein [Armatimonadetes bacterium]|nr:GAF domain-containing protein [Armatimonadota bacterium]